MLPTLARWPVAGTAGKDGKRVPWGPAAMAGMVASSSALTCCTSSSLADSAVSVVVAVVGASWLADAAVAVVDSVVAHLGQIQKALGAGPEHQGKGPIRCHSPCKASLSSTSFWQPLQCTCPSFCKAMTILSHRACAIPPRRRARGATWEKVTPKKLFGPKRDYDVMNAKIIEKYDCHTTTAALY